MRPAFKEYVSGYTWRSKKRHGERFGQPVLVKAGMGYTIIHVEFSDGLKVTCDKCCVRRTI
jgi:hypothetical protein